MAERVRQAMIEAERLGLMRRFVTFVTEHVSRDYFRAGAVAALRPIRGAIKPKESFKGSGCLVLCLCSHRSCVRAATLPA